MKGSSRGMDDDHSVMDDSRNPLNSLSSVIGEYLFLYLPEEIPDY